MNTKLAPVILATCHLPSGDILELTQHGSYSFDVDMWKEDGRNHWNKWFNSEAKARVEFERWRS